MNYRPLILSALVALVAAHVRADTFVTITPTGTTAATVVNRWAIGGGLSGLGYIDGNSGFPGATATNFFTLTGEAMPALGDPTGFTSYLPTGAATPQGSVGNSLRPDSYAGLTYVAENLSLIGPLSFYAIHHRVTGDYLALIQPSVPTVSDQKPMSVPGGPLTAGASGYFALSYAADNPGGWGAELFYYFRTNTLGETVFGSLIPALLSGPTDRWNLGAGRGYTDLAYTSTNVGFGYGPSQFYYLRLDPITQTTFFGRLDPLTGVATDIQDLGGVYRTLVFTPTNVGYGANLFYSIGRSAQTITFAAIASHTACDAPFTFVYPLASSGLPVTLAVSGPATVSGGNLITLTGVAGTVVLTASQGGDANFAPAADVARSFTVGVCASVLTPQTITFAAVPDHGLCDVAFMVNPTASSGLLVTLTVTSGPATVSGNTVTLTGAGVVTLQATQAGNAVYAGATPVSRTLTVAKCAATIDVVAWTKIFLGVPFNPIECPITTTTPAGLPVIVTYNGSTTLPAAVGTYAVVATINSPLYAGTATGTFVFLPDLRVTQTVSFGTPPITNHVFGDAPFTLNPSASSGFPTILAVISGPATVSGNTVTITGAGTVVLEVSQTGNIQSLFYAALTQSFTVTKAVVPIALNNLTQTFDGSPKSVLAATTPAGITTTLTYNGRAIAPSAVGSYAVHASITNANYQGLADATLEIVPVPVMPPPSISTITFATPVSSIVVNQPIPLGATATINLPITYAVVSGNATISGAWLTIHGPGPVVVRASQAGDATTAPASAEVTFTALKASQALSVSSIGDQLTTNGTVRLSAGANSGLPVSYALVSGPATLSGDTLTFNGAAGTVTVRVTQAGNDAFSAATATLLTFNVRAVTQQVYFGQLGSDNFAAAISADNARGLFITRLASTGEVIVLTFNVNPDGSFAGSSSLNATGQTHRISGHVLDGVITGLVADLGLAFSANVQSGLGLTAALAGAYTANAVDSASGDTYVVAGSAGQILAVTVSNSTSSSGMGTLGADGQFTVATSPSVTVSGLTDARGNVSGSVTAGSSAAAFAGLSAAVAPTDRMINVSARMKVVDGDASRSFIAGFVINGTTPKQVLIRAIGPGLVPFGVQNALANPALKVYAANGAIVAENDDWSANPEVSAAASRLGAFGLANGSTDAAVLVTLPPGAHTAQVFANGGSGIALIEVYDATPGPVPDGQQLINISARGYVDAGESALMAGFVVTGNAPKRFLIRGVGPALAPFGVPSTLGDPSLKVWSSTGVVIATNDDWSSPQVVSATQVAATAVELVAAAGSTGAFPLPPHSLDAALIVSLLPGQYTASVTGAGDATGAALVEVYEIPNP